MKRVLFIYNNFARAYLSVKCFVNNRLKDERTMYFDEDQLNNGLPINTDAVASFIKDLAFKQSNVSLILNCKEVICITNRMPKIKLERATKMVKKDLDANYPSLKNGYSCKDVIYSDKSGFIFYNYFIPNQLINYFNKICFKARKKVRGFDLYPSYLVNTLTIKNSEYGLFLNENECTTLLLCFKNKVFASSTFIHSEENAKDALIKLSSKHHFDLEKIDIKDLYTNIDLGDLMNQYDIKFYEPDYRLNAYEDKEF